jgi:hypothetical protein
MNVLKVRPKKDMIIRYPGNPAMIMSPDGGDVDNNTFWRRRLADGDVESIISMKKKEVNDDNS